MTGTDPSGARNIGLIRWLTCLMFFTFAMTTDAVGSVIPKIIEEFRLSLTAAGSFQYATMTGIAAGALLLGFLADRIGRKRTIILGLTLYGASSVFFAVSHAFPEFVLLLGVAGLQRRRAPRGRGPCDVPPRATGGRARGQCLTS